MVEWDGVDRVSSVIDYRHYYFSNLCRALSFTLTSATCTIEVHLFVADWISSSLSLIFPNFPWSAVFLPPLVYDFVHIIDEISSFVR